jgi:hypothetical protein
MADSATDGGIAEKYSLLPKLMPHLDRQLIYPLLNFPDDENVEKPLSQKKLLLELLQPTNMTDFVGELYREVHGLDEVPDDYRKKREQVFKKRDLLEEETAKISGLLDDENVVTNLRSDKVQNLQYLKETHGVTVEMVNQLYELGQFKYSYGDYGHAAELLYRFRVLVSLQIYIKIGINAEILTLNSPPTTTRPTKPPGESSHARSSPQTGRIASRKSTRSKSPSTPASSTTLSPSSNTVPG